MLRLIFILTFSFPQILVLIVKSSWWYRGIFRPSEPTRYKTIRHFIKHIKLWGRVETSVSGVENLPKDGGYVMFSNHQGKYDGVGIIYGHRKPCTFLMDLGRSKMPIMNGFVKLIDAKRLDRSSPHAQIQTMAEITEDLKNGRHYIIFPEGGYNHNRNHLNEFKPGTFKCAIRAKCPIVPVALVDTYKPFEINSLRRVSNQVFFLPPILYDDYKDLNTKEIARMVHDKIEKVVNDNLIEG